MKRFIDYNPLTVDEEKLLLRCKKALEHINPADELILYGSRAKGTALADSDFDLLIITDKEASLQKEDIYREELYPIELETGAVLTIQLITREQFNSALYSAMPFYQNVKRDGIIL